MYEETLKAQGKELPNEPEPFMWLRRVRQFNNSQLYWAGGLSQQPYYWMLELDAAQAGENEYRAIQAANKKLQAKIQKGQFR